MSQANVDTFKAGYQAFGSGDLETAAKDFSDDVEWWTSPEVPPTEGLIKGKQDLIASWQQIPGNWSDFSVEPSDFIDADDKVIVLGTQRATAKASGRSFESPYVQVAWFEDGKLTRAQFHSDSAAALKALAQ
jgi:ketosteroid isomerase-like protein